VNRRQADEWVRYRHLAAGDPDAAEKGRLLGAHKVATDPEARKRVEDAYGVDFCRAYFPEAYRNTGGIFTGVVRFLDRVKNAIPW
jgi:hypothetical protein